MKRSLQRRYFRLRERESGGSRACTYEAKADGRHLGTWSGCSRTLRRMGRGTVRRSSWELERPSSAPVCGREASLSITGGPGKGQAAERESEGVVVPLEGTGQHNPAGGKGPYFIDAREGREAGLVSAERSARSISRTEGVDRPRALPRVRYRSGK